MAGEKSKVKLRVLFTTLYQEDLVIFLLKRLSIVLLMVLLPQ